jgi:hypothetical protein
MVIVYFQRDFFPGKACLVDYPDPIAEPFDGLIVNLYLPHPLTLILSPGGERKPGKEVLLLLNAPFYIWSAEVSDRRLFLSWGFVLLA